MVNQTHIQNCQAKMKEKGYDALILVSHENVRYLLNFLFDDGYVVVTQDKVFVLTDFRYEEAAQKALLPDCEILLPENGMYAAIREVLEAGHLHTAVTEEDVLSFGQYHAMQKALQPCTLSEGASAVLTELRLYKDWEEVEKMKKAQKITDLAFDHILSYLNYDRTEVDVALELEFFMRSHGAEALAFTTIAVSGTQSALPHGEPRPVKLEKGFLTMDFGCKYDGYCSDMTRTVAIGKADDEMKELYATVLRAQTAGLEAAGEGASCRELDTIARNIIDANPKYRGCFGHSLGHGVGLYIHESPRLSQRVSPEARLMRGNTVTVEPGIYLPGKYGCRIEDMTCVLPDGTFYDFTGSPKELFEI